MLNEGTDLNTESAVPVTASAMAIASARVRYLTLRDDPESPCLAQSELSDRKSVV